jgi:hypothetical protein
MKAEHLIVNCEGVSGNYLHLAHYVLGKLKTREIKGSVYTFSSAQEDKPDVRVTVLTRTNPYITALEFECDAGLDLELAGAGIATVRTDVLIALKLDDFFLS